VTRQRGSRNVKVLCHHDRAACGMRVHSSKARVGGDAGGVRPKLSRTTTESSTPGANPNQRAERPGHPRHPCPVSASPAAGSLATTPPSGGGLR
jgi:hypothetical protein